MITPDGTVLESLHRHDYKDHVDKNGGYYMIDGGFDYLRTSSEKGGEKIIEVFDDEPFDKVRQYAFRTGYGKPGEHDYGLFRRTFLKDMTDGHLKASMEYVLKAFEARPSCISIKNTSHYNLLHKEFVYRVENNIEIPEICNI
jgi:hypothetical protein